MKIEICIDPACTEPKLVIHTAQMTNEIDALIKQLSSPVPGMIPVQSRQGIEIMPAEAIIRIYTESQKVYVQTLSGTFPVKFRLYEMEERLKGYSFVRISSSELVNTKMITGMDFSLTGTIRVTLKGGITTYVSRRRVAEIKKLFDI